MPREHGAYAMLLLPFLAAVILARSFDWSILAALAAAFALFMVREPLVIVLRQALVWRDPRPETSKAWRALAIAAVLLCVSAPALLAAAPLTPLAALGMAGAALTAVAVWMTVRNRQRAVWLQVVSAAGLASSALLAALVLTARIPEWAWWLWGLSSLDSIAGVLVVRVRLQRRIAARSRSGPRGEPSARAAVLALVAAAAILLPLGRPWLALAAALSAAIHFFDLRRLNDPAALRTPLVRVGLRAMFLSIAFTALLVAALW